jgi:hypothetical protein
VIEQYQRLDECDSPGMISDEEGSYVYFDESKRVMDEREAALKEVESREEWVPELPILRMVEIVQETRDDYEEALHIAYRIQAEQRRLREELE